VTNAPTAPMFPPGRYGHRRAPRRARRWVPVALLVLVLLGTLALALRLYGRYGDPPYQASVAGTEQVTGSSATVTLTVRKRDSRPALCRLRARDSSGAEVGYAEVPVGQGTSVSVRYTLATTARPAVIDVLSCRVA